MWDMSDNKSPNTYGSILQTEKLVLRHNGLTKVIIMDFKRNEYGYHMTITEVVQGKYIRLFIPNVCIKRVIQAVEQCESTLKKEGHLADSNNRKNNGPATVVRKISVPNYDRSKEIVINAGTNKNGAFISIVEHYKEDFHNTIYIPAKAELLEQFKVAYTLLMDKYYKQDVEKKSTG